jgi:hypothetical protein
MPVILSILRIDVPSASAATAAIFFSIGRVFAMSRSVSYRGIIVHTINRKSNTFWLYIKYILWQHSRVKRRGRPKKLDADKRTTRLDLRITKAEKKKIDADARNAGMTQSKWVRSRLGLT